MKTYEEWVKENYPKTIMQYKVYCTPPEELIGKVVVAARSGFSCGSEGGTRMLVDKIDDNRQVHLSPADVKAEKANNMGRGWCTRVETLPFDITIEE